MIYDSNCFNDFVRMIQQSEDILLIEGRDYIVADTGTVLFVCEFLMALTQDAREYEKKYSS